ncbi:hypothetical protein ABZV29_00965 [Streptomyces sp. NPDC005236]|uniref:hypothetical protein n=1 Tax=Streptomyces sp. NPDC005236 TaxID=3157028 RepID=UPI0033BAD939
MEPHREPVVPPGTGERRVGDGAVPGRRVTPPAAPGVGRPSLETLLAAAMLGRAEDRGADRVDGRAAETQAVAAFRAARDGGAHTARTRRRDDWRPGEPGRQRRSLRAAFAVLLAGLTLGGVAVAAVGPLAREDAGHRGAAASRPSGGAPDRFPGSVPPVGPGAPGVSAPGDPLNRPPSAQDTEAHCRAYASVRGRGDALDSRAWQRLVTAAGGEDKVEAFCAGQLAARAAEKGAKGAGSAANPAEPGKTNGTPAPGGGPATPKPGRSGSER